MQKKDARELLIKYKTNQCTPEEKALLESWYMDWNTQQEPQLTELDLEDVEREMMQALQLLEPVSRKLWPRIAAAAAVLVFLSFGLYFFNLKPQSDKAQQYAEDAVPGGNKAILILSDGRQINLQDAKSGSLASQGNTLIKKTKDGQLIYDLSKASTVTAAGEEQVYNILETPRSGTYQIILPDGSAVWLNASSSLKFPSGFSGNVRQVELKGEAYFEVAKNKNKPFRVISGNQTIEVLGTHFNVNNYKDEPVAKTTLLEGSIKVSTGEISNIIKPGEQAQLESGGHVNIVSVDTEQAIAWKNGVFSFKRADLKTVMRQIERWYDVDVEYEGEIPKILFTGKIYRNVNLLQALKAIGYLDVHFTVKGKKILIQPEP